MRKFIGVSFVTTLLSLGAFGGTAHAQVVISNTGQGSINTVTNNQTTTTNINCDIDNTSTVNNAQTSTSGSAVAVGNTTSGNVSSGNASNTSSITTAQSASCGVAQLFSRPTPGGRGGQTGGGGFVAAATSSAQVSALPATGEMSALTKLFSGSLIALGSVGALMQTAVRTYRRQLLGV